MDVLNDTCVEKEKGLDARPFPDEDYNKNGNLRKVRGRVLKKLLKYEAKAYLKPMLIVVSVLFAVAITLCFLGLFVTEEDIYGDGDGARFVLWVIAAVMFVYFVLFVSVFAIVLSLRRYNRQFFKSNGYLTLSIPATPEEHILAKRIAGYITMVAAGLCGILAMLIVLLPLLNILAPMLESGNTEMGTTQAVFSAWDVVYGLIDLPLTPLFFLSLCGGFCCWRHRGLKAWMVFVMIAGTYLLLVIGAISLGVASVNIPAQVLQFLGEFAKWVWLLARCGLLYLLFRYETQTLRSKINLK